MSFKKKYVKKNQVCKVTFQVPEKEVKGAQAVHVVGDFNNWNKGGHPMKQLKNGNFTVTIDLQANREYQFRYLLDEKKWENDWKADKYVRSEYGNCENSVIIV